MPNAAIAGRASLDAAREFIRAAFVRVGMPDAGRRDGGRAHGARPTPQGSDGHGVIRLPQYVRRIQAGGINLQPDIRVVQERAAWRCSTATTAWATW